MSKYWKIPLSYFLWALGHIVSRPMEWFDWGWLYKYYNWLMCHSADLDEWGVLWKPASDEDKQ